jgi:hypothetical protein
VGVPSPHAQGDGRSQGVGRSGAPSERPAEGRPGRSGDCGPGLSRPKVGGGGPGGDAPPPAQAGPGPARSPLASTLTISATRRLGLLVAHQKVGADDEVHPRPEMPPVGVSTHHRRSGGSRPTGPNASTPRLRLPPPVRSAPARPDSAPEDRKQSPAFPGSGPSHRAGPRRSGGGPGSQREAGSPHPSHRRAPHAARWAANQETAGSAYWMCIPEMARATIRRWISDVPSKIV